MTDSWEQRQLELSDELALLRQREREILSTFCARDTLGVPGESGDVVILEFECDGARLGLLLAGIKEVVAAAETVPIPGAGAGVCGMLQLGDMSFPVYDLGHFLHGVGRETQVTDHMIVVSFHGESLGLLVSAVLGVARHPRELVGPVPRDGLHDDRWLAVVHSPQGSLPIPSIEQLVKHHRSLP